MTGPKSVAGPAVGIAGVRLCELTAIRGIWGFHGVRFQLNTSP
jgi:hypothetical protein